MTPTTGKRSIFVPNKNGCPTDKRGCQKKTAGANWNVHLQRSFFLTPLRPLWGNEQKRLSSLCRVNLRDNNREEKSSVGERLAARGWTTIPDERTDRMGLLDVVVKR